MDMLAHQPPVVSHVRNHMLKYCLPVQDNMLAGINIFMIYSHTRANYHLQITNTDQQ